MKLPAKKFTMVFERKEEIAPGIFMLYFTKPDEFAYVAGQYLQMTLPHPNADDRGSNRFFTISSAPEEEQVIITSKNGKSSFKCRLFELQTGELVQCFGPLGTFILEESLRI